MRRVEGARTIYAVFWPKYGVLKVGRAKHDRRWRELVATGGRVVLMMRDQNPIDERAALAELDATFDRAFARDCASEHILPRGRGFTECFRVTADELMGALKSIHRGYRGAPVVLFVPEGLGSEEHWYGFRPDLLGLIASTLSIHREEKSGDDSSDHSCHDSTDRKTKNLHPYGSRSGTET